MVFGHKLSVLLLSHSSFCSQDFLAGTSSERRLQVNTCSSLVQHDLDNSLCGVDIVGGNGLGNHDSANQHAANGVSIVGQSMHNHGTCGSCMQGASTGLRPSNPFAQERQGGNALDDPEGELFEESD